MRILSFDTSTSNLHACLANGDNVLAEQILICNPDDRQFAASLIIPTLTNLFKHAKWQRTDPQLIVVGIGPGSFTGIRVAVVTARTLAQALNLPLLGINCFECYAFKEQINISPAAIILKAGKNQYFCAHMANNQMNTHYCVEEDLFLHLEEYRQIYVEPPAAALLDQTKSNNWRLLSDLSNIATTQAQIANYKIKDLNNDEVTLLTRFPYQSIKPLYIRNASVTVKASPQVSVASKDSK